MNQDIVSQKDKAILWAREVLKNKDHYVIFDTETTGLGEDDVIIHFAVMDLDGKMLIDTKVNPISKRRIHPDAQDIHGFTINDLQNAPTFSEVIAQFRPIASSRVLLSYNAEFHLDMVHQSFLNEKVSGTLDLNCKDVRQCYLNFTNGRVSKLPGRDNTGEGDCRATLSLITEMAVSETHVAVRDYSIKSENMNQTKYHDRNKTTAGLLAIFLGGIGMHKFYLGRTSAGILRLLFSWTFIPALIGIFDGIHLFNMTLPDFDEKFNYQK